MDGRRRVAFAVDDRYARVLRVFGVRPGRAWIEIGAERLRVRFGWWRFETPIRNVECVRLTGPYRSALRAIGPHISLKDRGTPSRRTPTSGSASCSDDRCPDARPSDSSTIRDRR
jgi:hypothetical protein